MRPAKRDPQMRRDQDQPNFGDSSMCICFSAQYSLFTGMKRCHNPGQCSTAREDSEKVYVPIAARQPGADTKDTNTFSTTPFLTTPQGRPLMTTNHNRYWMFKMQDASSTDGQASHVPLSPHDQHVNLAKQRNLSNGAHPTQGTGVSLFQQPKFSYRSH